MIIFILQLGGIGIMSLGTFIWLISGKKIGLRERQLIMVDHNQPTIVRSCTLNKRNCKTSIVNSTNRCNFINFIFYAVL